MLIEPVQIVQLPFRCTAIVSSGDDIYLAPFVGKGILKMDSYKNFEVKLFTHSENYRIYNFVVTPFAYYLNNGRMIEKFYINQGIKETIYEGDEISSFIVTPEDEIILIEERNQELVFLDYRYKANLKIRNIRARDIAILDGKVYTLTQKGIEVFDRYGNIIDRMEIPERFEKFFIDSLNLYLFSPQADYLYKWNNQWQKIEIGRKILSFVATQNNIYCLDDYGTNLYIYNRADF